MQRSEKLWNELTLAKESVQRMSNAQSFEELEQGWTALLTHLDRVWNKAEDHHRKSPKWKNWQAKYVNLRRTDPLLSYLINARNVNEHSIADITQRHAGGVAFRSANPDEPLILKNFKVENGVMSVESAENAIVHFIAAGVQPLAVANRGRTYNPPTEHLGNPIDAVNAVGIATAGAAFYEQFLTDAEAFFVTKPA